MVFSSALFLVFFLPILLIIYYLTPKKLKNIVLLIFSIFFYAWGAPKFIFVLLGTTFIDFHVVKYMDSIDDRRKRRLFLLIPLFINVGLLFYFKYANFFIDNVNALVGSLGGRPMPLLNIIMPIGISFYTFETLTYVVDVYRKVHKPLNHFWNYQLYIILFPKLIAGPIIRYHEISDQITGRFETETIDEKLTGFFRFCLGLGKKVLIANTMGVYADSTPDPFDDPKVENIVELAKRTRGMATGIVSTANITDATPAAMVAHTRRRSELNTIAASMLDALHRPDVILGGGAQQFLPMATPGSKRKDNRNLIEEFKALGYSFSGSRSELLSTPLAATKLLGLYNLDNMNVYLDREVLKNPTELGGFDDQPNLMSMTGKAINTLSKNPNGFFLMVEGASIDKQLHVLDWQRATYDTIELDKAIGVAKEFARKNGDTMIIVVADHAHGASITGTYHERDGKAGREAVRIYADSVYPTFEDRDGDGFPDNPDPDVTLAVQFANHPDFNASYRLQQQPTVPAIMANGKAVANPQTQGEFQPGNIPASDPSEVHAADDIILNAQGPGSEYFNGVMDNTEVFFAMARALGLDGKRGLK